MAAREAGLVLVEQPKAEDGPRVHALIAACPPLDENSAYANLLQCTHFAETCALATRHGEAVGWISGYLLPSQPDVYFLWQVAVRPDARGQGLALRMMTNLLKRPGCAAVTQLQATITRDNQPSWALFRALARRLDTDLRESPFFDRATHFAGLHDSELLVTLGPFDASRLADS
ncbi:uncharacterized protein MONBRDRAFT_5832 [Monosiga brevicollis MX1]|uniref:L-2,4-diaminobutyric acid acetyltransferase n=1 Tax=Monosiga brevicollis TaxID=81824 RepID=A9USL4_MONBE|nr:uncharacterized protein MONBRDRAFT_5832 [Monosiga brevicollis MX1]EDQ91800.1 predicted protein [Monosiga brevicollis MX1]|eukprot:XP_001743086.1 hypothetical protein [Monosiga brevicollis MX1]